MSSRKPSLPGRPRSNSNARRRAPTRLASASSVDAHSSPVLARRASLTSGGPKAQRTSKTSQKLVVLPSAPQTKPLPADGEEDLTLGHETDGGVREYKSQAERMSKVQREEAGYKRITAYCVSESFQMKLLALFLKREHNVGPRVFDEALYVMYHLPLLPGYGPDTNIRSSAPSKLKAGKSFLTRLSEAEENGYQGTYFSSPAARSLTSLRDGYISSSPAETRNVRRPMSPPFDETVHGIQPDTGYISSSPIETRHIHGPLSPSSPPFDETMNIVPSDNDLVHPTDATAFSDAEAPPDPEVRWQTPPRTPPQPNTAEDEVAEVVFFEYGVVVFFGLDERNERDILEDMEKAGILKRPIAEGDWEIEECHFAHDPHISYPRIYNDFFTLKSRSHLLKLSIAHALAQSTLLARYETNAQRVLSSPLARSIPEQLAISGGLKLRRHDALKLTGRLFKLRRDVNLVSNVLDVPELFWSEATLGELYDAVREYMEIKGRVQALNEKLGVASDFLDAIHDHLNSNEMTRITWIVIWLIVIAVLVELGEIVARLIVHATMRDEIGLPKVISKEEALRTLERMMVQS